MANGSGLPISSDTIIPISVSRLTMASCMPWSSLALSSTDTAAHPSKAARAAATALSTSAADPSGTRPMTSSVAGFTTSITSPVDGRTQPPSMNRASRSRMQAMVSP